MAKVAGKNRDAKKRAAKKKNQVTSPGPTTRSGKRKSDGGPHASGSPPPSKTPRVEQNELMTENATLKARVKELEDKEVNNETLQAELDVWKTNVGPNSTRKVGDHLTHEEKRKVRILYFR